MNLPVNSRGVNGVSVARLSPLMQLVEDYLLASRMDVEEFSRSVGERRTLVRDMRAGRKVGPQLEARIKLFISSKGFKSARPEVLSPSASSVGQRDEKLNGFLRAEARRLQVPLLDLLIEMTRKGAEKHARDRGIEF